MQLRQTIIFTTLLWSQSERRVKVEICLKGWKSAGGHLWGVEELFKGCDVMY